MKELKMRELRGSDYFPLAHIIGKLDIMDDFVQMFANRETITAENKEELERLIEERGYKVVARIIKNILLNLHIVKNELNEFLAELCAVKVKDIDELGIVEYTELFKAFFKKPELLGFLKSIASFQA